MKHPREEWTDRDWELFKKQLAMVGQYMATKTHRIQTIDAIENFVNEELEDIRNADQNRYR